MSKFNISLGCQRKFKPSHKRSKLRGSKPATSWKRKQLLWTARMRDQWGMSNVLKVSLQTTIHSLYDRGWSRRRIARELGIDRETVGRYLRLAKPAISTPGKGVGRKSQCEPLVEVITAKVEVGLSAQRIYQDLMEENGFTDSYQSVKRFPGLLDLLILVGFASGLIRIRSQIL